MILLYANPLLIASAILPAVFLLVQIYRADKLDKEPPSLIIALVMQGVAATWLAMLTERFGIYLLGSYFPENSIIYNALLYFLVVACSEEGFKYLLLRFLTWASPAFNCQFDGVVYAVAASLGFALWENISYVIMYGFGTALVRAVTAVPGHACFGVFMGAFYGMAKRYHNYGEAAKARLCQWMSFILPAILHGCYDFIASIENAHSEWVFIVFIVLLFIVASVMVKRLSKNDRYI